MALLTRGKLKKACGTLYGYEKGNHTDAFKDILNNDKEARELLERALNELSEYSQLYKDIKEALSCEVND